MHSLKYSKLAKEDLFHIFEIIARDKPLIALEYIDKLEKYIELLELNPLMGVECKNKNINLDCRVLIYGNYLIFYKIQEREEINIIRILNGKTDYVKKIKPENLS